MNIFCENAWGPRIVRYIPSLKVTAKACKNRHLAPKGDVYSLSTTNFSGALAVSSLLFNMFGHNDDMMMKMNINMTMMMIYDDDDDDDDDDDTLSWIYIVSGVITRTKCVLHIANKMHSAGCY